MRVLLGLIALVPLPVLADESEKDAKKPDPALATRAARAAAFAGRLLAEAADLDRSGDVPAAEWKKFVAGLEPSADGVVVPATLNKKLGNPFRRGFGPGSRPDVTLLLRFFDGNGDGVLHVAELKAIVGRLDRNRDGALGKAEMPAKRAKRKTESPQIRMARRADADSDGTVSSKEWKAFATAATGADGTIDVLRLYGYSPAPQPETDPTGARAARVAQALTRTGHRLLDANGDGRVVRAELDALFAGLDTNRDGALSKVELGGEPSGPVRKPGPANPKSPRKREG